MNGLKGQTALVTGAGGAIGAETAVGLTKAGARVVLTSRSAERLARTNEAVVEAGGADVRGHVADFRDPGEAHGLVRWILDTVGHIDVLVNNAGANSSGRSVARTYEDALQQLVGINVSVPLILCRELIPGMVAHGGGTIVTVSSFAVRSPGPLGGTAYGASKAALSSLMAAINVEYRSRGIRACTILPGEVDTPLLAERPRQPTAEDRATMIGASDIADAIVFCAAMPSRTLIEEIVVRPTFLRDTSEDVRVALDEA